MDHAPAVLLALTVAWLASRYHRHLLPALCAAGLFRPRTARFQSSTPGAQTSRAVLPPTSGVVASGEPAFGEAARAVSRAPLPPASRASGVGVGVRLEVGYEVSLAGLRQRVHSEIAGHALWDGRAWGMQVVDAGRWTVTVQVHATAVGPGAGRQLEADLREAMVAFLARHYPESLAAGASGDRAIVVPN